MLMPELVQRVAAHSPHLRLHDIDYIVDAILGEIADAPALGQRVELRGFGAFSTRQRRARWPEPAHRNQGCGDREARASLQGG